MNYFYDEFDSENEEENKQQEEQQQQESVNYEDVKDVIDEINSGKNTQQNTSSPNNPQKNDINPNQSGRLSQNAGQEMGKKTGEQLAKEGGKKISEEAGKKVAEEGAKQAATQAAAQSAATTAAGSAAAGGAAAGSSVMSVIAAGGPYVWIAVAIIVAIIVILIILSGIFMFLATMPGMAMDSLKGLFKSAGNFLAALFGADTTQVIDNEKVFQTLDYLDDMGWDLKGDGFLTKHIETESDLSAIDSTVKETANLDAGYYIDDLMGVVRRTKNPSGEEADNADDVILAESDFIFTYIMSDNYIYTIKNENIATQRDKFKGPLGWLDDAINRINCFRISCI